MARPLVSVVQRRVLPATIDGHRPILVTFRIRGPQGWYRLTTVSVNWGRGYAPGEFQRNVLDLLNTIGEREYVILLMQEIDEADAAAEHKFIREHLVPGTTLVEWSTREPIAISPGVEVIGSRRTMTMDTGAAIGSPGTGPRRFLVSCRIRIEGMVIGVANQHPHRNIKDDSAVQKARTRGERVTQLVLHVLAKTCAFVVDGGDFNDLHYPRSHPRQRVAFQRVLDYIRYIVP